MFEIFCMYYFYLFIYFLRTVWVLGDRHHRHQAADEEEGLILILHDLWEHRKGFRYRLVPSGMCRFCGLKKRLNIWVN